MFSMCSELAPWRRRRRRAPTTTNCKWSSCSEAEHHTPDIPWVTKKWIIRIYFKRIITCSEGQPLSPLHLELPSSSLHLLHGHVLALRHHLHLQQKPRHLIFEITDQGNIEKVCKYVKGDSNVDEINTSKVSLCVLSSCPLCLLSPH